MLEIMQDSADDVFAALAHSTRRQILQHLTDGEVAAGEIASRFSSTGPTISRHLAVLRAAGLVTDRRVANRILYTLAGDRLALSVGDFLATVCPEQMVMRSIRPLPVAVRAAGTGTAKKASKDEGRHRKKAKKAAKPV